MECTIWYHHHLEYVITEVHIWCLLLVHSPSTDPLRINHFTKIDVFVRGCQRLYAFKKSYDLIYPRKPFQTRPIVLAVELTLKAVVLTSVEGHTGH